MRAMILAGLLSMLMACKPSPVPKGMFLTMNVSTQDVAVTTVVNDTSGTINDFLSMGPGGGGSAPINKIVRDGENRVVFTLTSQDVSDPDPALFAVLEIALKGETVDTLNPGDRVLFRRELTAEEVDRLRAGETVTITQTFDVDAAALAALADG